MEVSRILEIEDPEKLRNKFLRQRAVGTKLKHSRQYLYVIDKMEVAYISLDLRPDINTIVVYDLYVVPDVRHQGIGSELMNFSENIARTQLYVKCRVLPHPLDNDYSLIEMQSWYQRQGYLPANDGTSEYEKQVSQAEIL